jgi:LysM repeat protein
MSSRVRYVRLGVPAAVLGVLASAIGTAPASAATPLERSSESRLTALPRVMAATTNPTTYTVQAGDTVFSIAQQFGLRTVDVLTWNGLGWRSVIYPGQTLALAAPASAPAAPAPATAPVPAPATSTHTVVAGDTIFAIAQKHATSVDAIYAANGLSASSIIYPGQTIVVAAAAPAAPAAAASAHTSTQSATLNAPQAENAAMIIRIGRELGVSDRGIAIALATSMVESWLRNLDWGDRDSLGLFQQRPSTGWGTADQIMDRDRSIRVFYGGAHDPNGTTTRGLLDVSGWEGMAFKDAAQAVQISAYPDRYAQWEAQAYEWIALYG